jgi:hypothetical protein
MEKDMSETIDNLGSDIATMLTAFHVMPKRYEFARKLSIFYIVEDFGLIVCGLGRADYTQVSSTLLEQFPGYRMVYITPEDSILEKKYEVLWALMRGGYMKWLRSNHPRQLRNTLFGPENLGNRIIEERLKIWGGKPKHKFLIEDNMAVLRYGLLPELSHDPGFFDYMPEND